MFTKLIPSLKENEIIIGLNKALSSVFYIALVAILLTISSIFDVGFIFYYILGVTSIILPCLFCEDMTAIIPFAVMLNIGINKGLANMYDKIVLGPNLPHFIIMLCIVVFFMFGRLIFDLITEKERRRRYPRLFAGYIVLLLGFCLGGFLSSYYSVQTFTFGLREFLALSGFYFFFFYTIDLPKMKKYYFAYLLFFFALSVSTQIVVEIIRSGLDVPLLVGWANRSGLGGTLVACYSASVYLIIKSKTGISWLFIIFALFFCTAIGLTKCRGAALTGLIISIICFVLLMVFSNKPKRIMTLIFFALYAITMAYIGIFQNEFFIKCFGRIFDFDFDTIDQFSSGRITIWQKGIDQFIHHPIFGVGWYQMVLNNYPARYHNTAIQLLAATGLVGLGCYLVHRFETIWITFKKPTLEKTFAFIALLAILISSLLDCFLFNIWLGFEYCFLLAFIESRNMKESPKKEEPAKPNENMQVYQTGPTTVVIIKR